jgi:hypothetical protein
VGTIPEATPAEDDTEITALAWGDVDNNRQLDLAVGYADGMVRIWKNRSEWKTLAKAENISKVWSVAWGDMDGDYDLDLAIGGDGGIAIYENSGGALQLDVNAGLGWVWNEGKPRTRSVAWGALEKENKLALAAGSFGSGVSVFGYDADGAFKEVWSSNTFSHTTAVAWGDYDNDYYLDLAVGNWEQSSVVYKNTRNANNWFQYAWGSPREPEVKTTSIAWGNYNGDGWLDLALGNYGAPNQVFKNGETGLAESGVKIGDESDDTTSIAWGYSDSKGTIELAVANSAQPSRIYQYVDNAGGKTSQFQQTWSSEAIANANAVAWGDWNSDGDLDLAVGGIPSPTLGIFANIGGTVGTPLVFVNRPGRTANAYFFSSAEIVSAPPRQKFEFSYALLGSDEKRSECYRYIDQDRGINIQIMPTPAASASIDGRTWYTVTWTPSGSAGTIPDTTMPAHYISDNARISVDRLCDDPKSPSEFTTYSPPFRLRVTSCIWVEGPLIRVVPQFGNQALYQFIGQIQEGSGQITYTWEFGDGFTKQGQRVTHRYRTGGPYTVNLKVEGTPCPINRPRFATASLLVGVQNPVFLPFVTHPRETTVAANDALAGEQIEQPSAALDALAALDTLPQVVGLTGHGDTSTVLTWQPPPDPSVVHGYRVYRYTLATMDEVELLAELPPTGTQFNDETSRCGHAYYVTTFADDAESDASTTTYYELPCPSD